ncbi:hypothetical protein RIF29_21603 [Crotalaria pallida]|uniref:Uncharacterized protein n=1 Tax=Crotalaria pallida TaxID=3830 RepID=A0AAN9F518_CROPI
MGLCEYVKCLMLHNCIFIYLMYMWMFHVVVGEELKLLVDDRDAAFTRIMLSSSHSHHDETLLHMFVAKLYDHGPWAHFFFNCMCFVLFCGNIPSF